MREMLATAALAGILVAAAGAQAADLHVSPPSGDDVAGDGSAGAPWRSITRALATAAPGDTIRVGAGTASAATGEVYPLDVPPGVSVEGVSRALTIVEGDPILAVFLVRP